MNTNHVPPNSMAAQRTYFLLSSALFELLKIQPFEKITLVDLCGKSMIPRSTFYHYYEDKYDLLRHCLRENMKALDKKLDVKRLADMDLMEGFFVSLLEYIEEGRVDFRKIYSLNVRGSLMEEVQMAFVAFLTEKMKVFTKQEYILNVPLDMLANVTAHFCFASAEYYFENPENNDIQKIAKQISLIASNSFVTKRE